MVIFSSIVTIPITATVTIAIVTRARPIMPAYVSMSSKRLIEVVVCLALQLKKAGSAVNEILSVPTRSVGPSQCSNYQNTAK